MKFLVLMESKGIRLSRIVIVSISFFVVFMLISRVPVDPVGAEQEKVQAPEWNKGDKWVYEARMGIEESKNITTQVEATDIPMDPNFKNQEDDVEYDETYRISRGESNELKRYYEKDSISLIYEDNAVGGDTFYEPARAHYDFPLWEGKEWSKTCTVYKEASNGFEPDHIQFFNGTVKNKTTTEVVAGEFETYVVEINMSIKGEDETSMGRVVNYYSPEVKRSVLTQIFETKRNPQTDELQERHSGTEELIRYDLKSGNSNNDNNEDLPLMSTSLVIGIMVSSAILYTLKRKRRN